MIRKTEQGLYYKNIPIQELRNKDSKVDNWTKIHNDIYLVTKTSYQLLIYMYLNRCWNSKYEYAYPSQKKISEDCHISLPKVKSTLKELEQLGLIKKHKHKSEGQQTFPNNCYYLYFPLIEKQEDIMPFLTDEQQEEMLEFGYQNYYTEIIKEENIEKDED